MHFQHTHAIPVSAEYSSVTTSTERKVISMRFSKLILICVTLMVTALFSASIANADSIGQCNLRPGNEMHSTSQWLQTLNAEGVLNQAGSEVFSGAGFNSVDGQSPQQWAEQRVVLVHSLNSYTGMDYSCNGGALKPWKVTTNPAGSPTFATLPYQYSKHNSSLYRTKKFSKRISVHGHVVGIAPCANTHQGEVSYFLYVMPTPRPKKPVVTPKPAPLPQPIPTTTPAPSPPPSPTISCSNVGNSGISGTVVGTNCSTCVGVNVCNEAPHETPPPTCTPPTKGTYPNCKSLPTVTLEVIQELVPNHETLICAKYTGENITSVRFEGVYGTFVNEVEFVNSEKACQYYKVPDSRPNGSHEQIKVTVEEENNPQLTATAEESAEIKYPELSEPPR
jgi:hypothetical protein